MLDFLIKVKEMDQDHSFMQMEEDMKDIGQVIRKMDQDYY
jgi:hypothetical protein